MIFQITETNTGDKFNSSDSDWFEKKTMKTL